MLELVVKPLREPPTLLVLLSRQPLSTGTLAITHALVLALELAVGERTPAPVFHFLSLRWPTRHF